MFSIITIASSTTKPVATTSAISDRLSSDMPAKAITAKVPASDSGTATEGMIVAHSRRRNTKITATTRPMVRIRVNCTSCTEARMVSVRSLKISRCTSAGSTPCSCGRIARMRSTVCTMLAPGWRRTSSSTAGLPSAQAASWSFSTPSTTSATSDSRTGRPFL